MNCLIFSFVYRECENATELIGRFQMDLGKFLIQKEAKSKSKRKKDNNNNSNDVSINNTNSNSTAKVSTHLKRAFFVELMENMGSYCNGKFGLSRDRMDLLQLVSQPHASKNKKKSKFKADEYDENMDDSSGIDSASENENDKESENASDEMLDSNLNETATESEMEDNDLQAGTIYDDDDE